MAITVGKEGAGSIFYGVYIREKAAYTRPTTLAEITTLLATADEVGYHEKDSIVSKIDPNTTVEAQREGSVVEVVQDYVGTFEAKNINGSEENIQACVDGFIGKDVDIFLNDPHSGRFQAILDVPAILSEETAGKASMSIKVKKIVNVPSQFRDRFSYKAFT
jgi:hypothetical protein